jgi:uncharacterized protein (DUF1499 family)
MGAIGHDQARRRRQIIRFGLISVSTAILLGLGMLLLLGARYPLINDITTDFEKPPTYLTAPPSKPGYDAEKFQAPTSRAYPDLKNLALSIAPKQAFDMVQALVRARGWQVAEEDPDHFKLQAVAVTPLMRFRDDVIIEVRAAGGGSVVAMRSKSRLGKGDLGANAKRIHAFLEDLASGKQ